MDRKICPQTEILVQRLPSISWKVRLPVRSRQRQRATVRRPRRRLILAFAFLFWVPGLGIWSWTFWGYGCFVGGRVVFGRTKEIVEGAACNFWEVATV